MVRDLPSWNFNFSMTSGVERPGNLDQLCHDLLRQIEVTNPMNYEQIIRFPHSS